MRKSEVDDFIANAADREQVRSAVRRERLKLDQERDDLRAVLGTIEGQRFLWSLLDYCKVFNSIFSSDPALMAHFSGRQDVGHYLMERLNAADSAGFLKLLETMNAEDRHA